MKVKIGVNTVVQEPVSLEDMQRGVVYRLAEDSPSYAGFLMLTSGGYLLVEKDGETVVFSITEQHFLEDEILIPTAYTFDATIR